MCNHLRKEHDMNKFTALIAAGFFIWFTVPAYPAHQIPATPECLTSNQLVELNKSLIKRELKFGPEVQKNLVELIGYAGRADYIMFAFLKNGIYGYAAFSKGCYVRGSAATMDEKTFLGFMQILGNSEPLPADKEA